MRFSGLLIGLLIAIMMATGLSYGAERIILPSNIYYNVFGSQASGAGAIWAGPAWLGLNETINIAYIADYYDGGLTKDWGLILAGDKGGIAYRHIKDYLGKNYNEYIFGVGAVANPFLSWGVSYQYIKDGPDSYHKRHLWNASLLIQHNKSLYISALLTNLNRGRIGAERSAIDQTYAVSYRLKGRKMILSAQINFAAGDDISKAPLRYGLAAPITPKITAYAEADTKGNYQLGLHISLGDYFAGGRTRFKDGWNDRRSSLYLGYIPPFTIPSPRR
jgi:hypothetical protein